MEKLIGVLSGGDMARLVLCSLMIRKPNVLVLDEPTEHLDLESIEALVEGLEGVPGTLNFVSHDRWYVAHLARTGSSRSGRGGGSRPSGDATG